jgi:hypothetical protein
MLNTATTTAGGIGTGIAQDKLGRAVDRRRRELGQEVHELRRVDLQGLVVSGVATAAAWAIIAAFAFSGRGTPSSIIAFVFAFQRLRGFLATLSWGLAEAGILMRDVRAVSDAAASARTVIRPAPTTRAPFGPCPCRRSRTSIRGRIVRRSSSPRPCGAVSLLRWSAPLVQGSRRWSSFSPPCCHRRRA